jgi:hypothetical protein
MSEVGQKLTLNERPLLAQSGHSHANSISASVITCVWIALILLGLATAV